MGIAGGSSFVGINMSEIPDEPREVGFGRKVPQILEDLNIAGTYANWYR